MVKCIEQLCVLHSAGSGKWNEPNILRKRTIMVNVQHMT